MVIDVILALRDLDRRTAGFLVGEIFAHGSLDVRRLSIDALRRGIHKGRSAKSLRRMLG